VVDQKDREHVNSSSCFGKTRTVSSSPDRLDRSAPGSSSDSLSSVSSMSIVPGLRLCPACLQFVERVLAQLVDVTPSRAS